MKEKKNKINVLGKILYVLAVISRVCIGIGTVLLVLVGICIPVLLGSVKIEDKTIKVEGIKDSSALIYRNKDNVLTMDYDNKKVDLSKELSETELLGAEILFDKLSDTTVESVIAYLEAAVVLSVASFVIIFIAIKNLEKFCKSLSENEEVFTEDKPEYLRKAAILFIINYIVAMIAAGVASVTFNNKLDFNFNATGIIEIIILFLAAYIFEYGCLMNVKPVEAIETKKPRKKSTKKEEK